MLRYFLEWSISVQESSPTSLVGKGWIHLQHTRKAVAFAHRSFLLFWGFEAIKIQQANATAICVCCKVVNTYGHEKNDNFREIIVDHRTQKKTPFNVVISVV